MTKIIIHGISGTMGQTVLKLCQEDKDIEVIGGIDTNPSDLNVPVYKSLKDIEVCADVIIDFSNRDAIKTLLLDARDTKTPLVLCTTGLKKEDIDLIEEVSEDIPIFKSANMSLGVNLIINLLKKSSQLLYDSGFDIEIIEKHHNKKVDSPSGTALMLADAINSSIDDELAYTYDRSNSYNKRSKNEIGIHGIRGGTIVGEHDVMFAGTDEIITFSHTATSKNVFAVGAIKAGLFLKQQNAGIYDMEDLIRSI